MSAEMVNLRAALACEYASAALRAAHTYESASHIYGVDTTVAITARALDGVNNLREAAALLGFALSPILNSNGVLPPTEAQDVSFQKHIEMVEKNRLKASTDGRWTADGGNHVSDITSSLLTAGGFPQKEPSATQDWFTNEPGYDANVSGRMG